MTITAPSDPPWPVPADRPGQAPPALAPPPPSPPPAAGGRGRGGRLARLRAGRSRLELALVGAMLALTTLAYLWDLSASGYANGFYAAAVEAATRSWKAFFFGSLDSSNFITVDKPAGFLWPMDLSARVF